MESSLTENDQTLGTDTMGVPCWWLMMNYRYIIDYYSGLYYKQHVEFILGIVRICENPGNPYDQYDGITKGF